MKLGDDISLHMGKKGETISFNGGGISMKREEGPGNAGVNGSEEYGFIDTMIAADTPEEERHAIQQLAHFIQVVDGWNEYKNKPIIEMYIGRTPENHYASFVRYGQKQIQPINHKVYVIPRMGTYKGARYWWSQQQRRKKQGVPSEHPSAVAIYKTPDGYYTGLVVL